MHWIRDLCLLCVRGIPHSRLYGMLVNNIGKNPLYILNPPKPKELLAIFFVPVTVGKSCAFIETA